MTRTCSTCGETKPLEDFAIDRSKPSGRRGRCYTCQREYWVAWRKANPDASGDSAISTPDASGFMD